MLRYNKENIGKVLFVLTMAWVWFVGFSYSTALGVSYGVYEKTKYLTIAIFFVECIFYGEFKVFTQKTISVILFFLISWIYHTYYFWRDYLDYIWVYLIPIVMSRMTVNEKQMNWISLIMGGCGFGVLYLANYTPIFGGWDGNSVSMSCFFGYTVFAVSFSELRERKLWFFILFSAFYMILLWTLNSRSAIVFSIFLILCIFSIIPYKKRLDEKRILLFLLCPLLIAIFSVEVIGSAPVQKLLEYLSSFTNKETFFSGRDEIWASGFRIFRKNMIFGTGSFKTRYHNSAVSCLTGAGGIAYIIWITSLRKVLVSSLPYIEDQYVYGLTLSFIAMWLQQSFELGLVAQQANVIPFTALGLLLARINTLKGAEDDTLFNNSSRL